MTTLAYVSDQRFYRDCDGYWYTTASFPLDVLATFMPSIDRILVFGRLEQIDYRPKDLYCISLPKSAKVEFRGMFNFGRGPKAYLRNLGSYKRCINGVVADANIIWLKLPFVASFLAIRYIDKERQMVVTQMVGDPMRSLVEKKGVVWYLPAVIAGSLSKQVMALADIPVFVSHYLAARYGGGLQEMYVFNENRITRDMIRVIDRSEMHEPIRLIYVGRLSPEKGLGTLLRALARLVSEYSCNIMLTIVGSGDSEGALRRLACKLDVQDRISLVGRLRWGYDLFDIVQQSDVLVLPSNTEGLPLVLLEGMSHSLPVVATKVGGIPEIVIDQKSGVLVPSGDSGALAAAIHTIITNDVLRLKLVETGLEVARRNCFEMQTGELAKMIDERMQKHSDTSRRIHS